MKLPEKKRCCRCKEIKSSSEFHKCSATSDGLKSYCKLCRKKIAAVRIRKPEHIYRRMKDRARTRKYGAIPVSITKERFVQWYTEHPKTCTYCGVSEKDISGIPFKARQGFTNRHRLEIDRMDSAGGYSLDNITLACPICNTAKSNFFTFEEMMFIGKNVIQPRWKKLKGVK